MNEFDGLTLDQKKGILIGDIDRLQKQIKDLEATVAKLAAQSDEYYEKRKKAAQEFDNFSIEFEKKEDQIAKKLERLKDEQTKLLKLDLEIKGKREKLNEDKDQFFKEKGIIRQAQEAFKEAELLFKKREEELKVKERTFEDTKDDLAIREQNFKKEKDELSQALSLHQKELSALKEKQGNFNQEIETLKKSQAELDKYRAGWESVYNSRLKELEEAKADFEKESRAKADSLKKRELAVIQQEKEIEKAVINIQAQKDDMEIKEAKKKKK